MITHSLRTQRNEITFSSLDLERYGVFRAVWRPLTTVFSDAMLNTCSPEDVEVRQTAVARITAKHNRILNSRRDEVRQGHPTFGVCAAAWERDDNGGARGPTRSGMSRRRRRMLIDQMFYKIFEDGLDSIQDYFLYGVEPRRLELRLNVDRRRRHRDAFPTRNNAHAGDFTAPISSNGTYTRGPYSEPLRYDNENGLFV
ncbi:hypothetical protein EVAR_80679_1 [Eumeta japonica]|uniref:Uncharacterized protein n=1 Tax=Eumeta variegata TaxID=151549 RepID=A0A4C1U3I2_EUMVA|nr:hypothetical protein EVAR_80679_1 [Eumeta japonica]